jgi:hypothetical protein
MRAHVAEHPAEIESNDPEPDRLRSLEMAAKDLTAGGSLHDVLDRIIVGAAHAVPALADEAGTNAALRHAVVSGEFGESVMTRAFTGRGRERLRTGSPALMTVPRHPVTGIQGAGP